MTILKALKCGFGRLKKAGIDSYQLDTEILLAKALFHPGKPEEKDFLKYVRKIERKNLYKITENTEITKIQNYTFIKLIEKRAKRIPIAYLTNVKEFYGLPFYVDGRVLIPRPQTETLVETAIEHILSFERSDNGVEKYSHETSRLRSKNKVTIADVGTGSGCIIISIIKEALLRQKKDQPSAKTARDDRIKFIATDTSPEALRVARLNAQIHRVANCIRFIKTDTLPDLKTEDLIIVSNLPYLDAARKKYFYKKSPELKYEPHSALFAKEKGFFSYRKLFEKILNSTFKHLFCVCETGLNLSTKIKLLISTISSSTQKRRLFSPSHGIFTLKM